MDSSEQAELVKAFMLRIAPELTRKALRDSTGADVCAEQALYYAMQFAAKYSAFADEALRTVEAENPAPPPQPEAPRRRGTLHAPRHDVDAGS